jgi:RNA polymerase-binding transcription factor DksA
MTSFEKGAKMKKFQYRHKRYKVQARRKDEQNWTEWTIVDNYDDAVKHAKRAEEAGYCARIIDKEQEMNQETCVSCGEVIPEGRQVCPNCERGKEDEFGEIH